MSPITISKKTAARDDLVTIGRKEYEELLGYRELIPIFKPTPAEGRLIARGRREIRKEKLIPWHHLRDELGHLRHRPRR